MMPYATVYEMLRATVESNASKDAYLHKVGGKWCSLSWSEAESQIERIGRALSSHRIKAGDRVGILGQTCINWALSDLATVCSGCVTVGIYPNNTASDCAYVLDHAEVRLLIVENNAQLEKILSVRDQLPNLRTIINWDGESDSSIGVWSWENFLARADETGAESWRSQAQAVEGEQLASLVYTSGTTGVPKGVMLSQKNLVFAGWSAGDAIYHEAHFIVLLFLPLAHVFARMIIYASMHNTTTMAIDGDINAVADHLKTVRPHYVPCVPRVFEKVHDRILARAEAGSAFKRQLFRWAIATGRKMRAAEAAGLAIPLGLKLQHHLADLLVLRKVRAAFGGRLVFAISGSAPLSLDVATFFDACGVLILEGVGMTENTAFSNVNRIDRNRFGTVGPAGRGVEIKIAKDGEILIRAGNVMLGYYKNPEATAETLSADGWLRTGDIGTLEDGFLRITDRKKDLIITAGGKNIAPQHLEHVMKSSPYVSQAAAYGDRKKYVTALITLDREVIEPWAQKHGLGELSFEDLASAAAVQDLLTAEFERLNGRLARYETIKRFHIVPGDFTIEEGELTPTMKLKRRVVVEKYQEQLDALY
jgi:long-chain acyl-CoA synthetase